MSLLWPSSQLSTDTHIYPLGGKQLSWMPTSLTSLWPGNGSIAERCCLEDVFASGGRASCVNCCHLTARSLGSHIFSLQSTLFSATSGAGRTTFCFLPRSFSSATRAAAYKSREPTPPEAALHSLGKEGSHQIIGPASQNNLGGILLPVAVNWATHS